MGLNLAGLGASPGWISKSLKPWASALRLDSDAETVGYRPGSYAGLNATLGWLVLTTGIHFRPDPK